MSAANGIKQSVAQVISLYVDALAAGRSIDASGRASGGSGAAR
jgi:hypothetical protein